MPLERQPALIQNLLPLFRWRLNPTGLTIAALSAALGLALWLTGAKFSRQLLALTGTIAGGVIGYLSPHWFDWAIDPWAVAVLGALILGIAGFMAHVYLAGLGLGLILAIWGALTAISVIGLPKFWDWPIFPANNDLLPFVGIIRASVPDHLVIMLFYAAGVGAVIGPAVGLMWPRLAVVLFWSLIGLTFLLLPALWAGQSYVHHLPPQPASQATILIMLILAGAGMQWRITFAKGSPKPAAKSPKPAA
jgi:hypothetical protein